jgi:hypothetical protein
MDAVTHAQHPVTGDIGLDFERDIVLSRFTVNAGRCVWNLVRYADLMENKR